jgi:hypothetical protein
MPSIRLPSSQWLAQRRPESAPVVEAPLDAEDMARVLTTFRGQPTRQTPPLHFVRSPADGDEGAYVVDEVSGMVYALD